MEAKTLAILNGPINAILAGECPQLECSIKVLPFGVKSISLTQQPLCFASTKNSGLSTEYQYTSTSLFTLCCHLSDSSSSAFSTRFFKPSAFKSKRLASP